MPLLSRLYGLNAASPLAALTQPQQTPLYGPEHALAPQTPTMQQGAVAMSPNKQVAPFNATAPQFQAGTQTPFWQRFQGGVDGLQNNSLFNLGMSLLAGSENGGDWGVVQDRMRQFGQDQRQRQILENEQRRQKVGDAREGTIFERQQQEWGRQDEQRQSLDEWVATLSPEDQAAARANPQAAHGAYMEAQAAARMPITPFQQRQLDLQARGLSIDSMNAQANLARANIERPLRGPDATRMGEVREAAARSQALVMLGDEFLAANAVNGTGELSRWAPSNFWDPNRAAMRAASSRQRGYMRPPGSGATSDFEQRLYALGAVSTDNTGPQNQAIVAGQRTQAALDQARMNFYEMYAQENGNLYGAEQAFQSSGDFRRITDDFQRRTGMSMTASGQPQQQSQRQTQSGGITPEQARAELERRQAQRRRPQQSVRPGNF